MALYKSVYYYYYYSCQSAYLISLLTYSVVQVMGLSSERVPDTVFTLYNPLYNRLQSRL